MGKNRTKPKMVQRSRILEKILPLNFFTSVNLPLPVPYLTVWPQSRWCSGAKSAQHCDSDLITGQENYAVSVRLTNTVKSQTLD